MQVGICLTLSMVFPKAGKESQKGLIPGLNYAECFEIIGRPKWRAWLLLVPIVGIFVYAGLMIFLVRSFGQFKWIDSFLAVMLPPVILWRIAKDDKIKYLGTGYTAEMDYREKIKQAATDKNERLYKRLVKENPYKKSFIREWAESIIFAVFAAAFIRMFLIEAYVIPTPSMEGSLLVGDYLFVSKASYGIRTPMTVAMIPLLHNRIPVLNKESYLKKPSLNYHRLPAFESIDRNDLIVFNWPVGDSVYLAPDRSWAVGQIDRAKEMLAPRKGENTYERRARLALKKMVDNKEYVVRPIDKKDHYIKRCVAIAGDSIQIKDQQLFVNGQPAENPDKMQFSYYVRFPENTSISARKLEELELSNPDGLGRFHMNDKQVEKLKALDPGIQLSPSRAGAEGKRLFPHAQNISGNWSTDNYGPLWIPKAGETIELNEKNVKIYRRTIETYEGNSFENSNGQIKINGEVASSYTFKQDYYWAMGDNRHNSEDSRSWGFVPHDHIVGKPKVIWWATKNGSFKNGVNWKRIFKNPNKI